jgi:hypothetical protein
MVRFGRDKTCNFIGSWSLAMSPGQKSEKSPTHARKWWERTCAQRQAGRRTCNAAAEKPQEAGAARGGKPQGV